jgi:circadian clock protein KaiC
MALLGATTVVIAEGDADEPSQYEEVTVCDVILALRREHRAGRKRRLLEVVKARGASPLEGVHPFIISQDGLTVFPRFESTVLATEPEWAPGRCAFGVERLDAMLGGGLNVGTTTLAAGSPGMGKTLLGLHFAAEGARVGEPLLFLGFMESAAQLREQARTFGLDLAAAEAAGQVRLRVLPPHDLEADYVAGVLAEEVEQRGIRRLVIDSAAELERAIGDTDRRGGFLSALVSYLRAHQVTSYLTLDIPSLVGPALEFSDTPLSVIAENLLVMRNVEYQGQLHRVFSVLKMRFSDHERAIYEHTISSGLGINILGPAPLGEGLLTGVARPLVDIPHQRQPGAG